MKTRWNRVACAGVLVAVVCSPGDAPVLAAADLFDGDVLQRIDLVVDPHDWDTLKANYKENDYYPAELRWNGLRASRAGIRSRGLGSRNGLKPGMRVDFGRYSTNQTFLGLRALVLDNLTQDASGVRERVAMTFYERLGLAAPREAHAEVYVNGQYAGLYAVVESIDEDFVRRVFGEWGYLFEYEYASEWFLTYPGPDLDAYRPLFDPVTHQDASNAERYWPIAEMLRIVNEVPDSEFESTIRPYLDLPLFMRHVAAQNFLAQWDGVLGYAGVNNFYLYRFERSPRLQFILWDEDNAFHALSYPILQEHDRNALMRRAMQVPALRSAYFEALLAAADAADDREESDSAGWLEREIQAQLTRVAAATAADTLQPFTKEHHQSGSDELLAFARMRPGVVRCEVAKLTEPAAVAHRCPAP